MSKKKTAGKFAAKKKKTNKGLVAVLVIVALLLLALAALMLLGMPDSESLPEENEGTAIAAETNAPETAEAELTLPAVPAEESLFNLGYGLQVTDMGSYTGMYMEDGTDEIVSGVLMLVVENAGEEDIQYAGITMDFGEKQAAFDLTTLPAGAKVVLLEKNRMPWEDSMDDGAVVPMVQHVAYFQEPISTMEEKLKIGIVDGAINVTNISGEDIPGTISVYYKNAAADIYYGGITYRIQIQGGLKADEIRQVMTKHASDTGSEIVFVTIGE